MVTVMSITAIYACETPAGYVGNNDDCDDQMLTYEDFDGDGFGGVSIAACGVISADDCDDMNSDVNPVASEICNYLDDNCNGESDEFVQNVYYADADADGFGDAQEVALIVLFQLDLLATQMIVTI